MLSTHLPQTAFSVCQTREHTWNFMSSAGHSGRNMRWAYMEQRSVMQRLAVFARDSSGTRTILVVLSMEPFTLFFSTITHSRAVLCSNYADFMLIKVREVSAWEWAVPEDRHSSLSHLFFYPGTQNEIILDSLATAIFGQHYCNLHTAFELCSHQGTVFIFCIKQCHSSLGWKDTERQNKTKVPIGFPNLFQCLLIQFLFVQQGEGSKV